MTVSRGARVWRGVIAGLFVFSSGVVVFNLTGTLGVSRGMFIIVMLTIQRFSILIRVTWVVIWVV